MKTQKMIFSALDEIAQKGVSNHADPYAQILAKIAPNRKPIMTVIPHKLSFTLIFSILGLIVTSVAVYAYYRLMIDPGLQAVQNAGLVTEYNQTAQPTIFSTAPAQKGVSVTLNWAYADEARIAFQLSVTGLNSEQVKNVNDFVCQPEIINDSKVHIATYLADVTLRSNQPGNPIDLTYLAYQHIDASQHKHLNLSMDLTIGPCGPYWNFQETNLTARTPFPIIGNYHIAFQAPVYPGVKTSPNQVVEKNGIKMRLASIFQNQSYVDLTLCYQRPDKNTGTDWALDGVTLQKPDGSPVEMNQVLDAPRANSNGEICETIGYAMPALVQSNTATLSVTVPRLVYTENEYNLSSAFQGDASRKLAQMGITVDFSGTSPDNAHPWRILHKPPDMTDNQANQKVIDLLTRVVEGPWGFVVTNNH